MPKAEKPAPEGTTEATPPTIAQQTADGFRRDLEAKRQKLETLQREIVETEDIIARLTKP